MSWSNEMKPTRRLITLAAAFCLAIAVATFATKLNSQRSPLQGPANPSPLYVVTFIDLMPPGTEAGTTAIKQYVLDTRKDAGNQRCEAIAQIAGRANHLAVIEVWKDAEAFEKHESAAHTLDYRAKMGPLIGAPFDQREHFLVE
jgi:quinol monooxygenase YgiN